MTNNEIQELRQAAACLSNASSFLTEAVQHLARLELDTTGLTEMSKQLKQRSDPMWKAAFAAEDESKRRDEELLALTMF